MSCFYQAEDGIRDLLRSRGLGDVYKGRRDEPAFSLDSLLGEVAVLTVEQLRSKLCGW